MRLTRARPDAGYVACPLQRETRRTTENDATLVYCYQGGQIVGACTWFDNGPRYCHRLPAESATPPLVPDGFPTAGDALLAVGQLGGHIQNNGAPGWLVLGCGLESLLLVELGRRAREVAPARAST